jgi:predicted GNAT family acetyltransferase
MTEAFTNNIQKNRFELALNGHVAFAEYRLEGSTLYIDRVVAPDELRGTGAAGKLMQNIVDTAQKEKLKIVPICPYAAAWMKKNSLLEESPAPKQHPYQVRIFLKQEFAEAVSRHETPEEIQPLLDVLAKHEASLDHNQFEEFSTFVKNAEAGLPTPIPAEQVQALLALTKASLANEEKASYFKREFTLAIKGKSMFNGAEADALIADLEKLGDGTIITSGKGFQPGKNYVVPPVRKSFKPKRHPGT